MKLLYDSRPLVIIPELATLVGLNQSIVLQQIHYWIQINRKAEKNQRDGHYWMYNSLSAWQEQFPFWSRDTIKRTLTNLRNRKILITDNYNKAKFDRTLWYRIDYEKLDQLLANPQLPTLVQNAPMQKGNLPPPIPETNQRARFHINNSGTGKLIEIDNYFDIDDEYRERITELTETQLEAEAIGILEKHPSKSTMKRKIAQTDGKHPCSTIQTREIAPETANQEA